MKKFSFFISILLIFSLQVNLSAENFFIHQVTANQSADTSKSIIKTSRDSVSAKSKKELLQPIHFQKLMIENSASTVYTRNNLDELDYRYAGDWFKNFPFGFLRDLGTIGQPNEVLIYGQGFGNVAFLSNGVSFNNRLTNSFDLNLFQSESIGSLEIVPLPLGFLFGSQNSSASVNLIPRIPNINKPYSRIKFYQAPNTEGLLDGTFSIMPFHKLNTYFEITNQSTNGGFANTDLSNWMATVRADYLLSKSVNIVANYRYFKSVPHLNGGVDVNMIKNQYPNSNVNSVLYDRYLAPVSYQNRYQKVSGHDFSLSLLGNFLNNSFTDLSIYYQTNLTEFRQNEDYTNPQSNAEVIIDNNESKVLGANLRQDFRSDLFNLTSIANVERVNYSSPLLPNDFSKNYASIAGIAGLNIFDKSFMPSVFAKYLRSAGNNYFGAGASATFALDNSIKLFGAFSSYEKPRSIFEEQFVLPGITLDKQKITSFELRASYQTKFINAWFGFFNQAASNSLLSAAVKEDSAKTDRAIYFSTKDLSLQGINLNLDFRIWKILLSTNTNLYFNDQNRRDYKLPMFTSSGGVYYVDTLFNRNLKLKAGINYYTVGDQDYTSIDFEKSITSNYIYDPLLHTASLISNSQISPSFQIDFFLAGHIQNSAIVYLVFENLLNANYFISPYYPKQSRGLRLGVAWEFLD
ncbi:MAG: hypothetical protein M1495_16430 [Bacteroidetes bacterium]|nr:hypothetical protein [Bacteroidota bacterium]